MNWGEVWWYELADVGRRPGCILTRQSAIPVLNAVLIAPATRTMRNIPSEVHVGPEDGMASECALSFDNLVTIPKALLVERICELGSERRRELCAALEAATGC